MTRADSRTHRAQYCVSFWNSGARKAIHSMVNVNTRAEYYLTNRYAERSSLSPVNGQG
jgi:hypothetical protein